MSVPLVVVPVRRTGQDQLAPPIRMGDEHRPLPPQKFEQFLLTLDRMEGRAFVG